MELEDLICETDILNKYLKNVTDRKETIELFKLSTLMRLHATLEEIAESLNTDQNKGGVTSVLGDISYSLNQLTLKS